MQARSDSLKLAWREWGNDNSKNCPLGCEILEDLQHFLVRCEKLQMVRNRTTKTTKRKHGRRDHENVIIRKEWEAEN